MSLHELTQLALPPERPLEVGDRSTWQAVEKAMKVEFPADLWDFVVTYGSGRLELGGGWIQIYNPFAGTYRKTITLQCENLRAFRRDEGPKKYPYKVYPSKDGLYALGSDVNSNEMYWLMKGEPDRWPIVLRTPDNDYERFDDSLILFLTKTLKHEISPLVWRQGFLRYEKAYQFFPESTPEEKVLPSIYEIYVENGNKAGFWVIRNMEPHVVYYVKSIDGKESGPLTGAPPEFANQSVTADSYVGGALFERDLELSSGACQRNFIRVNSPSPSS